MSYLKSGLISTILLVGFSVLNFSIGEAADYFPLAMGNRWVYFPSYGTGYRIDTIVGEELVNNVPTFIWRRLEAPDDNYSEKRWLAYVDSELRSLKIWSNDGIDPAITLSTPWVMLKANPSVGDTWISEFDIGSVHLKITAHVESIDDTVSVPAGTFDSCLRIRLLYEEVENSTTKYDYEKVWLAPDIGPIIYRDYSENWSGVTYSQELECFSNFNKLLCGAAGDIDGNGRLSLADIIYGLQVLTGARE